MVDRSEMTTGEREAFDAGAEAMRDAVLDLLKSVGHAPLLYDVRGLALPKPEPSGLAVRGG
jgi:hypothetical protein